ncbi:MAG: hypothetical protein RH860_12900 [Cytophagales bacterium]
MTPLKNIEKLQLLDDLFDQFIGTISLQEANPELSEEFGSIVSKNLMLLKRLKTQSKAELNRKKAERIKVFIEKFKLGLEENIQEYRAFADKIFNNPQYAELQYLFSNLEKVSEEDEKSMMLDAKMLELLDKLESDFNAEKRDGED